MTIHTARWLRTTDLLDRALRRIPSDARGRRRVMRCANAAHSAAMKLHHGAATRAQRHWLIARETVAYHCGLATCRQIVREGALRGAAPRGLMVQSDAQRRSPTGRY